MRILVTGATGFLGRALTLALRRDGHEVVAWVRSPESARGALGDQATLVGMRDDDDALRGALETCDAVVNLAGEPILARWTARKRAALRSSRVDLTARLVRAIERVTRRPRVLVSGSAVGFYGDRGDEVLDEESAPGEGFLPGICRDWEDAARRAEALGLRVVLVRTGVVLGLDGGALVAMLPPFRAAAGGRIGSGRQRMPWIHVEDWVRLVQAALGDERYAGAYNATAPEPPTNREYTRALAAALGRPAFVPVPSLALRAVLGGAASILLESQRAVPARAREAGFEHAHPTLAGALRDLLVEGRPAIERIAAVRDPATPGARGARYRLSAETELGVPLDRTFAFFSAPENLGVLTPKAMGFRITGSSGPPAAGSTIDYRIRVGPLPLRWRTRFEAWDAPGRFVDVQERGPYSVWWHEHRFEEAGGRTRMRDTVLYRPPLGPLGALANRLFIADQLGDIFRQRALAIRLRFGAGPSAGG